MSTSVFPFAAFAKEVFWGLQLVPNQQDVENHGTPNHGYYLHKYNYVALLNVLVFRASYMNTHSVMQHACRLIAKM